jgi:hypothetical protein
MKISLKSAVFLFIIAFSLFGCTRNSIASTQTATSIPVFTETVTSTPPASKVLLITNPTDDPSLVSQLRVELGTLSAQAGLTLEQRESLQVSDLTSEIKVVVFASTPADLNSFVGSAANIQFAVITNQDIAPAPNLTVVQVNEEFELFIAGYIAEMITTDWRVAALIPSDIPQSDLLQQAFQNGGRYWCGTCAENYPPYADFPLVSSLPAASDANTWKATVDQLEGNRIYTMVAWNLSNVPEVMQYVSLLNVLSEQGIFIHPIMLGNEIPSDALRPSWAVTLVPDVSTPLQAAWADLMVGAGGRTYLAGVKMTEINESLFGLGKQRLADETIQKLVQGLLVPINP